MFSAEVLSQLRSLNWLAQEIRRVPRASPEGALLQSQIEAVRGRLPDSILEHHDQLARSGHATATEIVDGTCGGCHAPLPATLVEEVSLPGRFGVCPSCGLFLWAPPPANSADLAVEPTRPAAQGSLRRSPR
jgi:predicted  nucleic acid-binding Zn-ribbon protein